MSTLDDDSSVSHLPALLVESCVRRPHLALLIIGALVLCSGAGMARLKIETSTNSTLNRSDASWDFYQHSLDLFGSDESIVVAFEAPRPFDEAALLRIRSLTDDLYELPEVRRVDSLSTVPVVSGSPDGALDLSAAVGRLARDAREGLGERVREKLVGDRIAPDSLISEDGRVFAINVLMDGGSEDAYKPLVEAIRERVADEDMWVTGVPVTSWEATRRTQFELALFIPITVVIIAILLFVIFGSLQGVAIPLLASGLGTCLLLGIMGALGTPLTLATAILPTVILALGCAYTMHILCAAVGIADREALVRALRPVALPVVISGVTTSIGFAAVAVIPIEAITQVGIFGAFGVAAVLFLALCGAPALLAIWPLPDRPSRLARWVRGPATGALHRLAMGHSAGVIMLWIGLVACLAVGIFRIEVETDVTTWFPEGTPVRDSYEAVRERLSGISPMNVVIESKSGAPVTRPDVLAALDGLTSHLRGMTDVGWALSVADPLRQLHGGFIDDTAQPLPLKENLAEQYLLLLESVEQLEDVILPDRSAANILLRVDDNGSLNLLDTARQAEAWWLENGPPDFTARTTGIMYEFARAEDEIAIGQLRGLGCAILAISVILYLSFRRRSLSILALVPNAIPLMMAFGFMGLVGIPLDAGTVLLGSFALGVAVDDTVHMLVEFERQQSAGATNSAAIASTFGRVLPPLVYTTLIVACGFAVLAISEFTMTRNLGLMTSALMLICLAADVLLLPALLSRLPEAKPLTARSQ